MMVLLLMSMLSITEKTQAHTHYQSFEHLEVHQGKLLEDYTKKEYDTYYKEVNKRKFMGWRVHHVHKNLPVSYITETLFSYYNDGHTAIDYKYKLERKTSSKFNISATGSIGIKNQKSNKEFKNNLDASLKLQVTYQEQKDEKEQIDISLKVDPGTQVDLYIYGEGKITNGVAARYIFWIRADKGGYEVFIITTQYQRLEKIRI